MTARTLTQILTVSGDLSPLHLLRTMAARHGLWTTWLVPAIYAGCVSAFIADLTSANTLAFGVFYAPLIVTAVFHRDRHAVWVLTAIACAMVVVGSLFPYIVNNVWDLIENRALSILALLATACLTWHARKTQDLLTEQTRRAANAERIKAEVLTNLSQAIRAPLHSMISVVELVAADGAPEHKAALGSVRTSGQRMLTTIDNIVDLTEIGERSLPAEAVDLEQVLRQTVEASRFDAASRQINLTLDASKNASASGPLVHANAWAVRRILENKIADAITYTAPGGRIEVSTAAGKDHVSAVISITGRWPVWAFHSANDRDAAPLSPASMGFALSQRLARAINAHVSFSSGPGETTTVQLQIPAAASLRN